MDLNITPAWNRGCFTHLQSLESSSQTYLSMKCLGAWVPGYKYGWDKLLYVANKEVLLKDNFP